MLTSCSSSAISLFQRSHVHAFICSTLSDATSAPKCPAGRGTAGGVEMPARSSEAGRGRSAVCPCGRHPAAAHIGSPAKQVHRDPLETEAVPRARSGTSLAPGSRCWALCRVRPHCTPAAFKPAPAWQKMEGTSVSSFNNHLFLKKAWQQESRGNKLIDLIFHTPGEDESIPRWEPVLL